MFASLCQCVKSHRAHTEIINIQNVFEGVNFQNIKTMESGRRRHWYKHLVRIVRTLDSTRTFLSGKKDVIGMSKQSFWLTCKYFIFQTITLRTKTKKSKRYNHFLNNKHPFLFVQWFANVFKTTFRILYYVSNYD